jgi:hypothetical protein
MELSEMAMRQAMGLGLTISKAQNLAREANNMSSVPQYTGSAAAYIRSLNRQYLGAFVRVKKGFIFILSGGICKAIYAIPDSLKELNNDDRKKKKK